MTDKAGAETTAPGDIITLERVDDGYAWDVLGRITQYAGRTIRAYVQVTLPDGREWHTEEFRMSAFALPDIEATASDPTYTSIEQFLTAIAANKVGDGRTRAARRGHGHGGREPARGSGAARRGRLPTMLRAWKADKTATHGYMVRAEAPWARTGRHSRRNRTTSCRGRGLELASAIAEAETGEGGRVNAETARVQKEGERQTADGIRVTAETNRSTAEGVRTTAEQGRANAETQRVTPPSGREGDAEGERAGKRNRAYRRRSHPPDAGIQKADRHGNGDHERPERDAGRIRGESSAAAIARQSLSPAPTGAMRQATRDMLPVPGLRCHWWRRKAAQAIPRREHPHPSLLRGEGEGKRGRI